VYDRLALARIQSAQVQHRLNVAVRLH
jgi:hypothetical protein